MGKFIKWLIIGTVLFLTVGAIQVYIAKAYPPEDPFKNSTMTLAEAYKTRFNTDDDYLLDGGVAIHLKTGLMWTRCAYGLTFVDGKCKGKVMKLTLRGAKKRAKELAVDGYNDWRIPTWNEMLSIYEQDRPASMTNGGMAINSKVFPDTAQMRKSGTTYGYWTSQNSVNHNEQWAFSFRPQSKYGYGSSTIVGERDHPLYYMMLVRGGYTAPPKG